MNWEDWLADPLMTIGKGSFAYLPADKINEKAYHLWRSFHFNTRLKLDGSDFFLRQLKSSICRPDWLGLPHLAYNFRQWYLDAFFFELMSAYESVVQELNAIFECGGKMTDPYLRSEVEKKAPRDLVALMKEEREKDWFKKLRLYRNSVSHIGRTPSDDVAGWGGRLWHYDTYEVYIYYYDEKTEKFEQEKIDVCENYFRNMLDHITTIWQKIKDYRFTKE